MGAYLSAKGNFYTIVFLVLIGLFGGMWFSIMLIDNFISPLDKGITSLVLSLNLNEKAWYIDYPVGLLYFILMIGIIFFTFRYSIAFAMSGGLRGGIGRIGDVKIPLTGGKRTPKLAKGEAKEISNKIDEFRKYHTYGWNLMWRPKTKVELFSDDRKEANKKRIARYKSPIKVATWKLAIIFIAFLYLLDADWKYAVLALFLYGIYIDVKNKIVEFQIQKQVKQELKQGYCALSPLEGLKYAKK